jgi:hypothetical protein
MRSARWRRDRRSVRRSAASVWQCDCTTGGHLRHLDGALGDDDNPPCITANRHRDRQINIQLSRQAVVTVFMSTRVVSGPRRAPLRLRNAAIGPGAGWGARGGEPRQKFIIDRVSLEAIIQ